MNTDPGVAVSRAWRIHNVGTCGLDVDDIEVSGSAFTLTVDPSPITLPPNTFTDPGMRVRCLSSTPGLHVGSVTVHSSDPLNPSYTLALHCQVTEPAGGGSGGS